MEAAFAPALEREGGCVNVVLVAAASGANGAGSFGIEACASRGPAKRDV